jgi:hypothetical protein
MKKIRKLHNNFIIKIYYLKIKISNLENLAIFNLNKAFIKKINLKKIQIEYYKKTLL